MTDIELRTAQHRDELAGEREAAEARLVDLLQCESVLEASQAMASTFTRASHYMAAAAALQDALPEPFIDGVSEMYQWLKSILCAAAMPQAESSLLYQVEASILPPPCQPQGCGTEGHTRSFERGNNFLTGRLFGL
jgi:hypothetical protein